MNRTVFRLLAISSLLVAATVAAPGRNRPRYGGALRVETSGMLWSPDGIAHALTIETLTKVDALGRVQPSLAMHWESQNRDRRWVFTLRPGVKFHDGSSLSPSVIAEPLNACAACPWHSVQASADTLIFDLESPAPLFPAQLARSAFGITKPNAGGPPIGTGPMRVQQATPASATLVAFDSYWGGRNFVDSVEVVAMRKPRDQALDLSVGRADLVEVPAENIKRALQDRFRVLSARNDELIALVVNGVSPSMQNASLRQAVAESVDRASLLNFIFQKQGELTGSLLPNWMTGYAMLFPASQNLPHARELRAQAAQSPTLTLTYDPADPPLQLVGERLALSARDAGITIRTVPAPAHWDLTLVRVRLDSFHPSVALEDLVSTIGLEHKAPDDTTPDALFQRERELLTGFRLVPLVYVPHAFAAGNRVRNWKLEETGLPALGEIWTEVRK